MSLHRTSEGPLKSEVGYASCAWAAFVVVAFCGTFIYWLLQPLW
jgi:hypothetical protein